MWDMVGLLLAASATTLATGLGAIPVFLLGDRVVSLKPALLGFAAGSMAVASLAGLILPGLDEGSAVEVGGGVIVGVAFLLGARRFLDRGRRRERPARSASVRTSILVFTVLLVHSLPEGFAIGTAYASDTGGLALFVIVAIAAQNVPEGTSVAIPMAAAGYSPARQFWAAVGTSIPQPIGAAISYALVEQVGALLPVSFGFAGGAMLTLVAVELVPQAASDGVGRTVVGAAVGAALMLALSSVLGV
jgi:ZIP family zinc transporter